MLDDWVTIMPIQHAFKPDAFSSLRSCEGAG